jgi:type II secretion system protein G
VLPRPKTNRGFTLIELLITMAIIGILAAIAVPNLLTALQRAKQKRTMASMRSLATAWEARSTDFGRYNAAGYIPLGTPFPFAELELLVSPTYIRDVPNQDGWQRRWVLRMDQLPFSGVAATRYQIISAGRDGVVSEQSAGPTTNFDCDIVYENGTFTSYPEGVQAD